MKLLKTPFALLVLILSFVACSDDDNMENPTVVINEEEVITTVELAITDVAAATTETISWVEGVNNNSNPEINLEANKSYTATIKFINASNPDDIEDITEEVINEKDEHYVFFTPESTLDGFTIVSADDATTTDSDDTGINIKTSWTTSAASTGILTVFLIHEPTTKTGTTRSDFGGETDIEVNFDITIE